MNESIKKSKDVTVAKAKGRPMLTWVGKKPLSRVRSYPAQAIERFDATGGQPVALQEADWSDWPKDLPKGGLLYHGDNKDVLAHLLANGFRGKVKLIYIDPPFDSGADYVRKVQLRGAKGTVKIDGEDYTLGEQVQYSDIWANDNYLQFMYERLLMLKMLLAPDGAIYLHCDPSRNSYLRLVLDEVFGADSFVNEIIWQRLSAHNDSGRFGIIHDTIYYYGAPDRVWNPQRTELRETYLEQFFDQTEEGTGRRYARSDLTARGLRKGETGKSWRGIQPAEKGNHWKVGVSQLEQWEVEGRIHWPKSEGGMPRLKRYMDEAIEQGGTAQDIWSDIKPIHNQSQELLGYPTQKPEALIDRVISASSNPGDIVFDCFLGSGTTAVSAQRLGRRWIGCDINKGAIQTTAKRIQDLMKTQAADACVPQQGDLIGIAQTCQKPSQLGFATYRVNDYDLQIQHNEVVELACQHLGVTRTRTDSFFEGTQGGRLVKIVPFNHPLTPLDLEAVRNELKTRPTEERDVMVVCLGWQHDARAWVETYNRNRPVNKLHVVELRTDRKLGGIIKHEPLTAQVNAERMGDGASAKLVVEVQDVVSPTIMQRLNLEQGVFRAQITDWRAVVDCILIDPQYDGQVFNVALADVPERKQDLVNGRYEMPAQPAGSTVAVKIIDMLGEEVIVTKAID
ncbi:site-specific DNA-methyltransferase [Leptothrix discophora]|uniref:Site-specific DNA-methyltransferase n=1 Tax=Leptothrix discophora TaxID=89 RepID=A0ABT9G0T3_LEPDI|nr:site-specific DNA-methyltransferase [Leptothrix discophora]MDP4300030.1 site-specific DNA-methyltransferase [Leptothrix discophora]